MRSSCFRRVSLAASFRLAGFCPALKAASPGFTLVELLVVIAIIGILASLLMSCFAAVKAKAKRIQCINNVNQLGLAWQLYAYDSTDKLVANGSTVPGGSLNQRMWVQGAFYYPQDQTNGALLYNPAYAMIAPYMQSPGIYHCPSDRPSGTAVERTRSYGLNAWMGWTGAWDVRLGTVSDPSMIFSKITQIANPSEYFTFGDLNWNSICWPYFGVDVRPPGEEQIFNYPASYHEKSGVIGFADGHVQAHRWQDPRTIAAASPDFHAHDDPSPTNADMVWLRNHATIPTPTD